MRDTPIWSSNFAGAIGTLPATATVVTRVISNKMAEAEERDHIRSCLDVVRKGHAAPGRAAGTDPEYGESERTPAILAELGVDYVLDWPNDEQPYLMQTPSGSIVSVPMALELDDVVIHYHRRIGLARWREAINQALDQLLADCDSGGRQLVLNLHPWLIGHPHRIGYLEDVLADARGRARFVAHDAGEIATSFTAALRASGARSSRAARRIV